jgi:hypothetical protein
VCISLAKGMIRQERGREPDYKRALLSQKGGVMKWNKGIDS